MANSVIAVSESRSMGIFKSQKNYVNLLNHKPLIAITLIIMYIYYALMNSQSAHVIHIDLNTIFYTHVEHSGSLNALSESTSREIFKTTNIMQVN